MGQYDSLVGKVIGNYQVQRELGRGGMGVVYKAHEQSLQRVVALKVLPPHLAADPNFVKRFEREARAVASLTHPNIVTIFAVGSHDDYHFMAMEYVKGNTIDQIVREKGRYGIREAVEIVQQAADALAEAHRNDVIHRDIKPHNIMIDQAGRVKVMDFGLAKLMSGRTEITATGTYMGTPSYMSPEQCQGHELDPRTDIYSLGIMLYEMLAGTPPFKADTPLAVMRKILDDPMPSLTAAAPAAPYEVECILSKMTAKDANARYASADDLSADLKAWLRGAPTSLSGMDAATQPVDSGANEGVSRTDKTVISGPVLVDTMAAPGSATAKKPNVAAALLMAGLVAFLLVGVIAGGTYYVWRSIQNQRTALAATMSEPKTPIEAAVADVAPEETEEQAAAPEPAPEPEPDTEPEPEPEPAAPAMTAAHARVAEQAAAEARAKVDARKAEADEAIVTEAEGLFRRGQAHRELEEPMEAVEAFNGALEHYEAILAALPPAAEKPAAEEAKAEEKSAAAEPERMEVAANTTPHRADVVIVTPDGKNIADVQRMTQSPVTPPQPAPAQPAPAAQPKAADDGQPKTYANGRLVDNGNGTVLDKSTGLIWQKGDSGSALAAPRVGRSSDYRMYAANLRLGGRASWRVPTKAEFMRLATDELSPGDSPFQNSGGSYWCFQPGQLHGVYEWSSGNFFVSPGDGDKFHLRCVTGP